MLQTIFAQSTPPGRSAISVLRIAGPDARLVMRQLAPGAHFRPRVARVTQIYKPSNSSRTRALLDEALVTFFKGPNSYTGDDVFELSLHGSPVVSRAVHAAINATKLARYAEPGEFTKRAFSNRRLDLSQVEGIRDLLAAETEMQRQAAMGGASGRFSREFEKWRSELVECSALLTAALDFMEDNGLEEDYTRARRSIDKVRAEISDALQASRQCSELVKAGIRVALLGEPNAGKSSLTNRLVQRTACIVSEIPGTTRDVLEVALEIEGHKVILSDTAGIRTTDDRVETLGIERARAVLNESQVVLALLPTDAGNTAEDVVSEISRLRQSGKKVLVVQTKSDLAKHGQRSGGHDEKLVVSSKTGSGINELLRALGRECDELVGHSSADSDDVPSTSDFGLGISERARSLLETEVLPGLEGCMRLLHSDIVLANAELQQALEGIGMITGRSVSVHEVLDVLFGEFCIGK